LRYRAQTLAHKQSATARAHTGRGSITTVNSNRKQGYLEVTAVMPVDLTGFIQRVGSPGLQR
jgi:hypothetical protein